MPKQTALSTMQRQLMEQGVSEEEARKATALQWAAQIGGDFLGGLISGVGMSLPKEIYDAKTNPLYGVNERTARMIDRITESGAPQQGAMPADAPPPLLPQQRGKMRPLFPGTSPVSVFPIPGKR